MKTEINNSIELTKKEIIKSIFTRKKIRRTFNITDEDFLKEIYLFHNKQTAIQEKFKFFNPDDEEIISKVELKELNDVRASVNELSTIQKEMAKQISSINDSTDFIKTVFTTAPPKDNTIPKSKQEKSQDLIKMWTMKKINKK
ncbi:hypothetical protein BDD43_2811 [Mucilaginibacter gracilis]|uniref:Uncharacterized protein n=1 Tax=Mucilaginibacter gracilis TaxID=423350 RepID=A0A495J0W4_9SPHI|nr:hypothetical protein [Mucilaginibacter gracilis]RKR82626.1 hypothetical protein BDD43_2811 [Mucilaginibacter gracilis]